VHLLWKPDPKTRDQVRLSLTRSWRAPATATLIGRPTITRLYDPALGSNVETSPDVAGNPELQPSSPPAWTWLSSATWTAAEFSAPTCSTAASAMSCAPSRCWRRSLEPVPAVGAAHAQHRQRHHEGLELEAKFRLDQWLADTPPVELRANVSLYRSQVDSVPGPDNRLDEQAKATANLGPTTACAACADPGRQCQLGAATTPGWPPTRPPAPHQAPVGRLCAVGLQPGDRPAPDGNNLLPRAYATENLNDSDNPASGLVERTRVVSGGPTYTNWQLRLELKL